MGFDWDQLKKYFRCPCWKLYPSALKKIDGIVGAGPRRLSVTFYLINGRHTSSGILKKLLSPALRISYYFSRIKGSICYVLEGPLKLKVFVPSPGTYEYYFKRYIMKVIYGKRRLRPCKCAFALQISFLCIAAIAKYCNKVGGPRHQI